MSRRALVCAAMLFGFGSAPSGAQDLLCCNLLVPFKGDWFGALRQCREKLEQASPPQIRSACSAVKGNVCEEVAPFCRPCRGDEAKKCNPRGDSLAPGDPIYDGLVDGARAAGIVDFGAEHISVQQRRGLFLWQIRVDTNGCPMPGGDCIMAAGEGGYLPEGRQEGAKRLALGSVLVAGNALRVNGRYVNVETGVIEAAAVSDAVSGTDRASVAKAMSEMLARLGLQCRRARGLEF